MGSPSVDAYRAWCDAYADRVGEDMGVTLLAEGQRFAQAVDAAAPKGKTGRLEQSAHAGFGDPDMPGGTITDFRHGGEVNVSQSFAAGTNFATVVITAGGADTTKPVKHGKTKEFDYAIETEFGSTREKAHPFFYPTWRREKSAIEARLAETFGESQLAWDAGYGPEVSSAEPPA